MIFHWFGPPAYEWISHNLFVVAVTIGSLAVIGYYLYRAARDKERSR